MNEKKLCRDENKKILTCHILTGKYRMLRLKSAYGIRVTTVLIKCVHTKDILLIYHEFYTLMDIFNAVQPNNKK